MLCHKTNNQKKNENGKAVVKMYVNLDEARAEMKKRILCEEFLCVCDQNSSKNFYDMLVWLNCCLFASVYVYACGCTGGFEDLG